MTALSIVENACSRLGLTKPTIVFTSTDAQIIQLRDLMNEEILDLGEKPWTKITKEKTFTTVAQAVQTSSVPSDFSRYLDDTMWNRTTRTKMVGPVSAEEWQALQAMTIISIPQAVFRFRGGDILIYPSPTAGQTGAYEYVSDLLVYASGGSTPTKTIFSVDTDTCVFDEDLVTAGVRWRFLSAKGFDYAEAFRTYEGMKQTLFARDGGKRKVYLGGYPHNPWNGNI